MNELLLAAVLAATLALFVWGKWRFDIVAVACLLSLVILGIVPSNDAFTGFGHPAVITVAAVLVVSRGLTESGVVDLLAAQLSRVGSNPTLQLLAMMLVVAVCSAFMNNIGALALMLPVAMKLAREAGRSPSFLLMPLAFASLLGGLTTLIGSPPNIIISTIRAQETGAPFRMFDFTPVGAGVAAAGIAFMTLVGWRLIPKRAGKASRDALFEIDDYLAEVRVGRDSKLIGEPLRAVSEVAGGEVIVAAVERDGRRMPAPSAYERIRAGDALTVEADSETIQQLVEAGGLSLAGNDGGETEGEKGSEGKQKKRSRAADKLRSDEVAIVEAVVAPDAPIEGRTPRQLHARWRFGVNLLAVARQGSRLRGALSGVRFRAGDVLLLQMPEESIHDALRSMGCLPLAERRLTIGRTRRVALALTIFVGALALVTGGVLQVQVAFVLAAALMVLAGLVSLRHSYSSIDWPIIVLLGAMIPVGAALETTGAAARVAGLIAQTGEFMPAWATLAILMAVVLLLSDVVNNAAAAVLMAPVAIGVAHGLEASPDPFLMATVLGASAAFLTPIGHQSNTLVLGPGGYRFGDYWRMGLPLSIVYIGVGVPLILLVWPLHPAG